MASARLKTQSHRALTFAPAEKGAEAALRALGVWVRVGKGGRRLEFGMAAAGTRSRAGGAARARLAPTTRTTRETDGGVDQEDLGESLAW